MRRSGMDADELRELFGESGSGGAGPSQVASSGTDVNSGHFDFNPDFGSTRKSGAVELSARGAAAAAPTKPPARHAPPPVDPEELRRRIAGSGSKDVGPMELKLWGARTAALQGLRRCFATARNLTMFVVGCGLDSLESGWCKSLSLRHKLLAAGFVLLLLTGGYIHFIHGWALSLAASAPAGGVALAPAPAAAAAAASGAGVLAAATTPPPAVVHGELAAESRASVSLESVSLSSASGAQEPTMASATRSSRAAPDLGPGSEDLVALRRAVEEGDKGIREELAALRSEVARLGAGALSSGSGALPPPGDRGRGQAKTQQAGAPEVRS